MFRRIRRIADNDLNRSFALAFDLFGVFLKEFVNCALAAFVEFKRIGQADVVVIDIFLAAMLVVKYRLDVDIGDVIGEQDDFVAMEFLEVFAFEVFVFDDTRL